jgi:hypothetical protein
LLPFTNKIYLKTFPGGVLLLERQHHQGQVLAEARQEEQGGLRLPQAHLLLQEGEAPLQGLETGENNVTNLPFITGDENKQIS